MGNLKLEGRSSLANASLFIIKDFLLRLDYLLADQEPITV